MRAKASYAETKVQALRKIMTKEAVERLAKAKAASPVMASQLENYLIQVYEDGHLKKKIDDKRLKGALDVLMGKRKR